MTNEFTWCDNHPAKGGPHKTRAVIVGPYFDHEAVVVMCTARLGKRQVSVCKNEYLILRTKEEMFVSKRWNVIARNTDGKAIAAKTNVRTEKERDRYVAEYRNDARVSSVDAIEFEVER